MQRDLRLDRLGAVAGILGPLLLAAYFGAPALAAWPFAGAAPDALVAYARSHELLFYAGGWLQATGALLSGLFLLVLVQLSGARDRLEGLVVAVGVAVLLSVVLVEAALLEAVPMAASSRDRATVATRIRERRAKELVRSRRKRPVRRVVAMELAPSLSHPSRAALESPRRPALTERTQTEQEETR